MALYGTWVLPSSVADLDSDVLGIPDPDPLVRGMDLAPDPSCQAKIVRKTLIPSRL